MHSQVFSATDPRLQRLLRKAKRITSKLCCCFSSQVMQNLFVLQKKKKILCFSFGITKDLRYYAKKQKRNLIRDKGRPDKTLCSEIPSTGQFNHILYSPIHSGNGDVRQGFVWTFLKLLICWEA